MPRKATKRDESTDDGTKAYRHTRTGAIRRSASKLGYPFEEVSDAELRKAEREAEREAGGESTE